MSEEPLERLNFFNGQRLQADDFQLEQDYHTRVRRWLNRSLYTPGIAMGLAVYAVPGAAKVRVEPGLAIDHLGREIILLDSREIDIIRDIDGQTSSDGPYLVIRYHEQVTARQDGYCAPAGGDRAAQGGPSRVLEEPKIECVPDLPHEYSGKILLGRIELAAGCGSIKRIDTSVRRSVEKASTARVRQYALEGFRDIDPDNPGKVYFHVRGQQATGVYLYLRSEELPTLYYTEMGEHIHAAHINMDKPLSTSPATWVDAHTHTGDSTTNPPLLTELVAVEETSPDGGGGVMPGHSHTIRANVIRYTFGGGRLPNATEPLGIAFAPVCDFAGVGFSNLSTIFDLSSNFPTDSTGAHPGVGLSVSNGEHLHYIYGSIGSTDSSKRPSSEPPEKLHSHQIDITSILDPAGVTDPSPAPPALQAYTARSGAPINWVDDLSIEVDGVECTEAILSQVRNSRPPSEDWSKLGQGAGPDALDPQTGEPTDPLAAVGTGAIKLDYLVTLREGEHVITLSVPSLATKRNGGRIHYNLYIE